MFVRAPQLRCSTATAGTASAPVALLSLPASSSWNRIQRSRVRRRRSRFVLAAVVSRLAAFAPIVALLYSHVAKLLQDSCPSAFPRWTISRSFSRCSTSGRPVRNPGFASVRQSLTILNRPSSAKRSAMFAIFAVVLAKFIAYCVFCSQAPRWFAFADPDLFSFGSMGQRPVSRRHRRRLPYRLHLWNVAGSWVSSLPELCR